jgi:predicted N-acyltransferase
MEIRFIATIDDCPPQQWDRIAGSDYPFLQHRFLAALERSASVGGTSGWQPHHALLYLHGELAGVMPLYIKLHSYGEYVFDWSWADAYQRHGLRYYPKLLSAIPFTPATGPRLALAPSAPDDSYRAMCDAIGAEIDRLGASSWHVLFADVNTGNQLESCGLLPRLGVQYHWFNRDYPNFDAFLAQFNSRKRKALRRERRRVREQGITLHRFRGDEITPELWHHFYFFYQLTYAKRSGHGGYLKKQFFDEIGRTMRDSILLVMAQQDQQWIAGALNFVSGKTLYGRYWGCSIECEFLHFEACYYQGIEYCIEQGLRRFDPGAQGEHKIQRGFTPVATRSHHLLKHEGFRAAIADFLAAETPQVRDYSNRARSLLPFKSDTP